MPRNRDNKQKRDQAIMAMFNKLYHVEKKQFQECINKLHEAFYLAPTTIEDIIRKQKKEGQ